MIKWAFNITHGEFEDAVTYRPIADKILQINETDIIEIVVDINETHCQFSDPYILIGDVPIDLKFSGYNDGYKRFVTIKDPDFNKNQLFFNYFGESEIQLKSRENYQILEKVTIDVKARKANAELARTMLDYISDNADDLISLCFSKSFIGGNFSDESKDNMHKFNLLRKTISYFYSNLSLFYRDYKYKLENALTISQQGQPTGPDSVYWLLHNLDKIMPSNAVEANFKIKNRTYTSNEIPTEVVVQDTDVFENRVINSFLYSSRSFLFDLKNKYKKTSTYSSLTKQQTDDSNDFVSFDHTLKSFKQKIINNHVEDINVLVKMVDKLINLNSNKLKSKLIAKLRPRITPFVMKRPHYRNLFIAINEWYNAGIPNLDKNNILLGLRNLSAIYEMTTLLMISKDIPKTFNVELNNKEYRKYSDDISFEGNVIERPTDKINNYFFFDNEELTIELLFEPRIYSYRKGISKVNDIINISNKGDNDYGEHYYLPDYIIRINNSIWKEPLVIILDAKYSDRRNVLKYSLQDASDKYLHNLFQFKSDNIVGTSPVKLMMVLFAHGANTPASFLHKQHHADGELPVYPQSVGIKYIPNELSKVPQWLTLCFDFHNRQQV